MLALGAEKGGRQGTGRIGDGALGSGDRASGFAIFTYVELALTLAFAPFSVAALDVGIDGVKDDS